MPSGAIELRSQQALLSKLQVPRPTRPADDSGSFSNVLRQKRQAAQPKHADDPSPVKSSDKTPGSKKPAAADSQDGNAAHEAGTDAEKKADRKDVKAADAYENGQGDEDVERNGDVENQDTKPDADLAHSGPGTEDKADQESDGEGDAAEPTKVKVAKHADAAEISPDAAAAAAALQQASVNPIDSNATEAGDVPVTADAVATVSQDGPAKTAISADPKAAAHAVKDKPAAANPTASLLDEETVKPLEKSGKALAAAEAEGPISDALPADNDAPTAKPAAKPIEVSAPVVDSNAILPAPSHFKAATLAAQQQLPAATSDRAAVAANNVEKIVTNVKGNLGATGGTMQIRLDPPTLGSINISVSIDNGVMTATMQTENEQATRMLSHSLSDLKTSLESAGITVDKIQVKQASPSEHTSHQQSGQGQSQSRDQSTDYNDQSRQDQQRRELLQRMWRRVSGNLDDLDLVA